MPPENARQATGCPINILKFRMFHIKMVENTTATNPLVKYEVAR